MSLYTNRRHGSKPANYINQSEIVTELLQSLQLSTATALSITFTEYECRDPLRFLDYKLLPFN
jgi:hypothetical protein